MIKLTFEQYKELRNKLPRDIYNIYSSEDFSTKMQNIAKKHQLHVDQSGNLFDEINAVMLGATHPNSFVGNVSKNLNIPEDKARAIAGDVNSQIFMPIRQSLMKLHEARDLESETQNLKPSEEKAAKILPKQNFGVQTSQPAQKQPTPPTIPQKTQPQTQYKPPVPPIPVARTYNSKPATYSVGQEKGMTKSLVEEKTYSIMKIPAQEITLKETPNTPNKSYMVDPYREQIS